MHTYLRLAMGALGAVTAYLVASILLKVRKSKRKAQIDLQFTHGKLQDDMTLLFIGEVLFTIGFIIYTYATYTGTVYLTTIGETLILGLFAALALVFWRWQQRLQLSNSG